MTDSNNSMNAQNDSKNHFTIAVIGSGPGGLSAAARAAALGIPHILLEAEAHASDTIYKYQKGKHVMAEPTILPVRSDMPFEAGPREVLLDTWDSHLDSLKVNVKYQQRVTEIVRDPETGHFSIRCESGATYTSINVVLAIGLQGNIRKLGCQGEDLPLVQYTLADPGEYVDETIIVVGAGDAAIENALGLSLQNNVIMMVRADEFARCKEGNRRLIMAAEKSGKIKIHYSAKVVRIEEVKAKKPLMYFYNGKTGEGSIACDRVIGRLGASPPRQLIERFGVQFPNPSPGALPVLTESYESNVPKLYIVGALGGYPLIKQAMNQGYEVVQTIIGKPVLPADEDLLLAELKHWKPNHSVSEIADLILKSVPLFKDLTKLQIREVLLDSTILTPEPGSIIFNKFDYTDTFYSIIEGRVGIEISGEDGNPKIIKLSSGQYFGEMSLISGRRRTATIHARKNCVLLEIPRRAMLKLMAGVDSVRIQMDEVFVRNAISSYIGPMLDTGAVNALVQGSVELRRYNANEVLFKEDDEADGLYLIRRGSVTVSKKVDNKVKILSYVSAGQYVGEMALVNNAKRSATVTATVMTEALVLKSVTFKQQLAANPAWRASIESQIVDRTKKNVTMETNATGKTELIQFMLGQGVGEASDILLINETICVQCNNCEIACAETHGGTSRLRREAGATFANIHIPDACRHCEHPECMKDCPPDALSRHDNGEVYISDACIGCGNCEHNCPYGVIHMAMEKPPKRGAGLSWLLFGLGSAPGKRQAEYDPKAVKKAVKCDLCMDIKGGPACVRACPTGAAIRISPEKFFKLSVER